MPPRIAQFVDQELWKHVETSCVNGIKWLSTGCRIHLKGGTRGRFARSIIDGHLCVEGQHLS
ncbi:MAG: hypothetical protein ABIP75_05625, partial [Pyrinomonadaceae bacterium]